MTPVMFAYGGWQTASFMSGELKRPQRDLAIGLLAGVAGVIAVYLGVNYVCLHVLGAEGLAATTTPASAVMRAVMGERGATLIAAGIAVSTLGFLSQGMLTAPRVYYAMAEDRLFFRAVGKLHPKTRVPVLAIVLQGIAAIVIALSGTYEQILSYVVSVDFIFFGLTGLSLFVFRKRIAQPAGFRTPLHPVTTALFVIACWAIVIGTFAKFPVNSTIGIGIMAAGLPAWWWWARRRDRHPR
jgi:APA family basic amino acid/polyamine antiporter